MSYNICGVDVLLPAGHPLPHYQKNFKRYDRFLPFVVKRLTKESGVIDIGANCGDTLASLVCDGPHLRYLCVEPLDDFFRYLEKNAEKIKHQFPLASIQCSKLLVGTEGGSYLLKKGDGTASAVKIDNLSVPNSTLEAKIKKVPLGELVKSAGDFFLPKLIKIDVDGFDYDVIESGMSMIEEKKPILYFECNPTDDESVCLYLRTIEKLIDIGYANFSIFDNFGEYILSAESIKNISDLIRYFLKQETRTFHYVDIVATATNSDNQLVLDAIIEFNEKKF